MSLTQAPLSIGLGTGMSFFSLMGAGARFFGVPGLLFVLHRPLSVATGTSLASACVAATVGTVRHARAGVRCVVPRWRF